MFSISKSISNFKETYPDIDISCLFYKQKEFLKNVGGLDYFLGTQSVKYQKEAISYFREIEKSKVGLNKFDNHFLHEDYQVVFYPIFCKNETIGFVYGNIL